MIESFVEAILNVLFDADLVTNKRNWQSYLRKFINCIIYIFQNELIEYNLKLIKPRIIYKISLFWNFKVV